MIILEKPYVSDFLIETIKKNKFDVLDNEVARGYFNNDELCLTSDAINIYNNKSNLFYTNSENSIEWVFKNLPNSDLAKMIEISKDKVKFRNAIKTIFPDYYFEEIDLKDIKNKDVSTLKFPVILKPSVGFLSFGVYTVKNKEEWKEVVSNLEQELEKTKGIFPQEVVNTSKFIIEEMIKGEEYAVDAYFDKNGNATILNIFKHPFFNDKDVSDRAYYTSKEILTKYLEKFTKLLSDIGHLAEYSNFPFHLELRVDGDKIIPIELNPLRMCGWCITDIAYYAWGINVYEYFLKQLKPDWDKILKNSDEAYYYFTIADIPSNIDRSKIKSIDMEKYLLNIKKPLDIRKIDYRVNPIFAIVFAKTIDIQEIKNLLELDMGQFINR